MSDLDSDEEFVPIDESDQTPRDVCKHCGSTHFLKLDGVQICSVCRHELPRHNAEMDFQTQNQAFKTRVVNTMVMERTPISEKDASTHYAYKSGYSTPRAIDWAREF